MKNAFFRLTFCLLFSVFTLNMYAQEAEIDSLKRELETAENDTNKVDILYRLTILKNVDSTTNKYINEIAKLSEILDYEQGKGFANHLVGVQNLYKHNYEESIVNLQKAYDYYPKNTIYAAAVLRNIGNIYFLQGKYEGALDKNLESLKIAETIKDTIEQGSTIINIGLLYFRMKQVSKAKKYYENALNLFEKINHKQGMSLAHSNLGQIYSSENDSIALMYYEKALAYTLKTNDIRTATIVMEYIASIYARTIDNPLNPQKAYEIYNEALQNCIKLEDKAGIVTNYINIGRCFIIFQKYDSAEIYLQEALQLSDKYNIPFQKEGAFNNLFKLYKRSKKYKEIYSYVEDYMILKDSMMNEKREEILTEMETKYETEKKEAENATLKAENAQQEEELQTRNLGLIAGGVILLILGVLVSFVYRSRQKIQTQNRSIQSQNDKIQTQNRNIQVQNEKIDTLYKEYAHRTKNQFNVLIALQNRQLSQSQGNVEASYLLETKNQIQAMSLIHTALNQMSADYQTEIALDDYLRELTYHIVASYGKNTDTFEVKTELAKVEMDANRCGTLGLIINELISNSLKYAYEGVENPMLFIGLKANDKTLYLTIQDNGKGFEESDKNGTSKGLDLVENFTAQLHGDIQRFTDKGTRYEITFMA